MNKRVMGALLFGFATVVSVPSFAQTSAVQRANDKEQSSIEYRKTHCPSGDQAACDRANRRAESSMTYRDEHATQYQRDPNAAVERADRKDKDSVAYRQSHCASGDTAACQRANGREERAIGYRDSHAHKMK